MNQRTGEMEEICGGFNPMLPVTLSRGAFGAPGRRLFEIVGAVPRRQVLVFRGFFGGRSPFRDEWEIVLCLFLLVGHYLGSG